jgi:hypothetical protein
MSAQPLLKSARTIRLTEDFAVLHQETANQISRAWLREMSLLKNSDVNCPAKWYSRVIKVVQAISILEAVLSQHNVFGPAPEYSHVNAPAPHGHIYNSAVAAAFAR